MPIKRLTRLALLASLCIVLRITFGAFPNIKPITATFFLLVSYFSLVDSLIVMALTMTVTGLLMGFGPWIWWQIVSYSVLLTIWAVLKKIRILKNPQSPFWAACLAGVLAFSYGALMAGGDSWQYATAWLPYWLNGLKFDLLHAGSTFFFYPILNYIFWRIFTHEKNFNQS